MFVKLLGRFGVLFDTSDSIASLLTVVAPELCRPAAFIGPKSCPLKGRLNSWRLKFCRPKTVAAIGNTPEPLTLGGLVWPATFDGPKSVEHHIPGQIIMTSLRPHWNDMEWRLVTKCKSPFQNQAISGLWILLTYSDMWYLGEILHLTPSVFDFKWIRKSGNTIVRMCHCYCFFWIWGVSGYLQLSSTFQPTRKTACSKPRIGQLKQWLYHDLLIYLFFLH